MDAKKFFTYSAIGALLWASGVTVLGYFLGEIEFIEKNIDVMAILIVLISVIPIVIEIVKARREKKHAAATASDDDPKTEIIERI
jgi:membrane-associated protein